MSSCLMMNHESDEDVDLEALRMAALKSRKPRYPRINRNNLIPIVPVNVETPDMIKAKIKQEKVSPTREINIQGDNKIKDSSSKQDEKLSNYSGSPLENDPDILSMDDKEEEDSLEKLMDQLEAEISGKAPLPSSKRSTLKEKNKQNDTSGGDDEVELLQMKSGKEPKAIIEIRESASPETNSKQVFRRNSASPKRSPGRRSRSRLRSRSRSRSFYSGGKSYRRSKSPYWSRSPHKSRSPFRRSRSPYWSSRRTRSKSRSPFKRYRSPGRKRSPFLRFSRSRSRSYGRRRSPWSFSPRRRSKSPFYRDGILSLRRRNFNSPGRLRRSYTPKDESKSPKRRSRSPRRVPRHSPYRRSKSPYRSRSPYRTTSLRRSLSPFLRRSKSPIDKLNSPNRSPLGKRQSNSSIRKSNERASSKPWSPLRSGRAKGGRSRSKSPVPLKNRSPLKVVEKNKLDERSDRSRDRDRLCRRHRSLSRENNRTQDRRSHRRGFFPSKRRSSRSPKQRRTPDKNKESKMEKEPSLPTTFVDPVLEARKKKFETLGEVDPTVDKKINLKAIKESTENPEEDEDALTINIENNLWDESEESEDEFESRFKSDGARRNRVGNNRTVLSFRNLRESDTSNKVLNKPLTDENRWDRNHKQDPWSGRRNDRERRKRPLGRGRSEDNDTSKSRFKSDKTQEADAKKPYRKPIIWYSKDEKKSRPESKDNEVSTTQTAVGNNKNKSSERIFNESDKGNKSSELVETDDFDKLISDFEKELESDTCFSTNEVSSVVSTSQEKNKTQRISIKRGLFEPMTTTTTTTVQSTTKLPPPRIVKIRDASSTKLENSLDPKSISKVVEVKEKITENEPKEVQDGPEDYIEDDDFVLGGSATRQQRGKEEEDKQSDLRAVLSKRRNERLTKVASLQENMPTRLVQSAFQGLGHKKLKKPISEVQELELPSLEKSVKNPGVEGRRVLLLHRDKNPLTSLKYSVPEVKPDTTIHQRFPWSKERRKRKLHRQQDPNEEMDQEEEEEGFEVEEEKHFRRFRLKRNITMSSQGFRNPQF